MILFLYGKDTFRSRKTLHEMIEKFKKDRDPSGMNVARLNCEKADEAGEVMGQILAAPFLAEKRLVVVENLLASKQNDLREELTVRIEKNSLPEFIVLVIWEGTDTFKAKDQKALFERLQKEKYAQAFELQTGAKLNDWVSAETAARGGKIDTQALTYLTANTKGDTWSISSLLDQLIAYKGASPIALSDVQLFLDERADDNIFNLVDAIMARQAAKAFAMMEEQYKNGEDSGYIFAMVLRQCRILLEIRDLLEREPGASADVIAGKLKLHPFVVKKTIPFAKKYSMEALRTMYSDLLQIDLKTKTGQGDQSVMLDLFVARVCAS